MVAAANMAEKSDSKLDTESLDSVSVPTNYSVTSEPPPYKWHGGKSVKIARLIAITVVAVAALLGGAIVLAAYIQTKGSHCTATDTRVEAPLPTTASLAAAEIRDILKEKEPAKEEKNNNIEALKTAEVIQVEEKKKEKEEETQKDDDEEEEEMEIDLGKLMRLPFDVDKLAKMFLDINRKDNTNCFVEKVDLDDSTGKKPTRIMDIGGVSVAVICETVASPKPSLPFPFGMAISRPLMLQGPLRGPFNSPSPFAVHPQMLRPPQRMSPESLFGPRPPFNPLPFVNQPPRHLVPPARRLDTAEPMPPRSLVQEPRPQQQLPVARGMPFLPPPLPQRPTPEVRQPASIPVSPLTVPAVRGNPDPADRPEQSRPGQEGLPRPRGRSLNFDAPVVVPFAEEKVDKPAEAAPQPPSHFMNFLRSIINPQGKSLPPPQQRSLTPAHAIPIPVQIQPIQARLDGPTRPVARELRLQPVITLPQFLQAPPVRSHTIQPRSVN